MENTLYFVKNVEGTECWYSHEDYVEGDYWVIDTSAPIIPYLLQYPDLYYPQTIH